MRGIKIEKERITFYILNTILAIKKCSNVLAYKTNTQKSIAFIRTLVYNSNKNNKTLMNKFTKKSCRLLLGRKSL